MKNLFLLLILLAFGCRLMAQQAGCIFKEPVVLIHFGTGNVREVNTEMPSIYGRVNSSCPTDGHYAYTSFTSDCFGGDWFNLTEDHTPGDEGGNMMLVNASPVSGRFLVTAINGLKTNTTYEFSVWLMNVCRISDKCPFPLLPNITILLQTPAGQTVALFGTGDLPRLEAPRWTPYRALFTTPSSQTPLTLIMMDNAPGGCGNDFAMDDIGFRECEKPKPIPATSLKAPVIVKTQSRQPVNTRQQPKTTAPLVKKDTPIRRPLQTTTIRKPDSLAGSFASKQNQLVFAAPPPVIMARANPVIKQIQTEAGEIRIDLYDNGEIDGDTVSIYHNNKLVVAHARLSDKAISFRVTVNPEQPHHELVMVAENLGSIPPNTSLMIVTAGTQRYEVFISSTEQKNAKILIDLKQ